MDRLEYRTLRRRIRPARVAVRIGQVKGWQRAVLRMLENYSVTWGGAHNIIVPADEKGVVHNSLWPLIELFDADVWGGFADTLRSVQLGEPDVFDAWLQSEVEKRTSKYGGIEDARDKLTADRILDDAIAGWPPPPELGRRIIRNTAPAIEDRDFRFEFFRAGMPAGHRLTDVCDLMPLPARVVLLDTHSLPLSLQVLVAMRWGSLAPTHLDALSQAGVTCETQRLAKEDVALLLRLAWVGPPLDGSLGMKLALRQSDYGEFFGSDEIARISPSSLSAVGLREMQRWHPDQEDAPLVVVAGSTADDFSYALLLDRCGVPAWWLPTDLIEGGGRLALSVLEALASCLVDPGRPGLADRSVALVSLSRSRRQLQGLRTRLRNLLVDELDIDVPATLAPPPFRSSALLDPDRYEDILDVPFLGDQMAQGVPVAVPTAVRSSDPWKLTWWAEVDDPNNRLPARAALNQSVVANSAGWRSVVRCGRDGISFFSHSLGLSVGGTPLDRLADRPRLRFPRAREVFDALADRHGWTLYESSAGRFRRFTTDLWGGLGPLTEDLRNPYKLALLRSWLSEEQSGDAPGVYTGQNQRWLSLDDASTAGRLSSEDSRSIVDSYLHRGILRRGHVLKCCHCLHFTFYPVGQISQSFTCARCETRSVIAVETWRGGLEPDYYYDLAEVVYQAFRGNFEVPVRALGVIADEAESFEAVPEVEVRDADGAKAELDILAIADGRIIVGEAKSVDYLKSSKREEVEWLQRMGEIAEALTVDEVVLATSTKWRQVTRERIETVLGPRPFDVRLMEEC